jgi:hypothetical protein
MTIFLKIPRRCRSVLFRNPRGRRFGPDGNLYCVAREAVVSFDFVTGA